MNIFKAFLIRRIQFFIHNFLIETIVSLLLPIIFMLIIGFPLISQSPVYKNFPEESWILLGIIFSISFVSSFLFTFNDIQIMKKTKLLSQINITPASQISFIFNYILSIIPLEFLRSILIFIILHLLIGSVFNIQFYFFYSIFIIINILLSSNLGFTFGILNFNFEKSSILVFLFIIFIYFFSCWLIPISFYPDPLKIFIEFFPTYILVEFLRSILFENSYSMIFLIFVLFFIIINYMLNIYLYSKNLSS